MNSTTRDSLEQYDEEQGLINIEESSKCSKFINTIYILILLLLSVSFLLALYYKLTLYITNKDKIIDCNDDTLYLCGLLVFPFIVLFTAVNEFIEEFKKY
tara:strand:- start:45 stop:344 length:300 start_codon:yes stop_codon:yes gene_type:complete